MSCYTQRLSFHLYREILAEESNVQRVEFPVTVSKKLWVVKQNLREILYRFVETSTASFMI